jgi:uncharacterized membrane protein
MDDEDAKHGHDPVWARWAIAAGDEGQRLLPGWLRPHRGEQRWSVSVVITVAIVFQILLPDRFVLQPRSLPPILEGAIGISLILANPGRLDKRHPMLRLLSLFVIGCLAVTNVISTILLIKLILGGGSITATKILASGAAIWVTNVIVYALWYWEFDRGGPVERALAPVHVPDFLFPQMSDARLDPDWHATFFDYFYVSFTNATAFSPTDTMPLSRWAKLLMLAQSAVSLITVGLVAARAINILPGS